jgi:hypothetical protein
MAGTDLDLMGPGTRVYSSFGHAYLLHKTLNMVTTQGEIESGKSLPEHFL